MLHTKTSIEYRHTAAAEIETKTRLAAEQAIDGVLADSFPASDPPSWNPGIARPVGDQRSGAAAVSDRGVMSPNRIDVIDVSRPNGELTFLQGLASLAGASALALMVPLVVLLIGLPFAVGIRALLHVIGLAFGVGDQSHAIPATTR